MIREMINRKTWATLPMLFQPRPFSVWNHCYTATFCVLLSFMTIIKYRLSQGFKKKWSSKIHWTGLQQKKKCKGITSRWSSGFLFFDGQHHLFLVCYSHGELKTNWHHKAVTNKSSCWKSIRTSRRFFKKRGKSYIFMRNVNLNYSVWVKLLPMNISSEITRKGFKVLIWPMFHWPES